MTTSSENNDLLLLVAIFFHFLQNQQQGRILYKHLQYEHSKIVLRRDLLEQVVLEPRSIRYA